MRVSNDNDVQEFKDIVQAMRDAERADWEEEQASKK